MFNPTIFSTSLLRTYCRIGPDEAIFLDGVTVHLCCPASRSLYRTLLHMVLFSQPMPQRLYTSVDHHLLYGFLPISVSGFNLLSLAKPEKRGKTWTGPAEPNASQVSIPCTRRKRLYKLMPDHADRLSFQSLQSKPLRDGKFAQVWIIYMLDFHCEERVLKSTRTTYDTY